jgi:hypothetical protein
MTEQEKSEINEAMDYVATLGALVGGIMTVLDEEIPDFRDKLRSGLHRQLGSAPELKNQIELALAMVDGIRHFVRN